MFLFIPSRLCLSLTGNYYYTRLHLSMQHVVFYIFLLISQLGLVCLRSSCLRKKLRLIKKVLTFFYFVKKLVGSSGLEPPTSRLSGVRSNRLSYEPSYIRVTTLGYTLLICIHFRSAFARSYGLSKRNVGLFLRSKKSWWR
jgi:hypothetical protein